MFQSIAQKACHHFRLGPVDDEHMLMTEVDGVELELTNDLLKHLKSGTVVTLRKAPDEDCHSDNDRAAAGPSFSAVDVDAAAFAPRSLANSHQPGHWKGHGRTSYKPYSTMEPTPALYEGFHVYVHGGKQGEIWAVKAQPADTIDNIKQKVQDKMDGRTLSDYDIRNKASIYLIARLRGGKPVIYLFPRIHLPHATVTVTLTPEWSFSHIYPIVAAKALNERKQAITWSVSADSDGTLVEKDTGRELSYLFWEALSNPAAPQSPPSTPLREMRDGSSEHFDPSSPVLEPDTLTAVMLPFTDLLPYLDRVLKTLSLHTSARNDFITYWLPALSKKPFIALRFLPQAAYEHAAELNVEPKPDVVTRVFMLFKAVPAEGAETWAAARARAEEVDWVRVVGVELEAFRPASFRVLEWGAMEVL
ncbi:hypothetical protein C8Q80DRAFT_672621 [Daedaleopsis nitida]|nr:hypothetical protein C8Q80DRAFT_672621 [Daedaleopsis nitida]